MILAQSRLFYLLMFASSLLYCMEHGEKVDNFATLSKDIIQNFMLECLPNFQDKGNFGLTSKRHYDFLKNLPGYANMAEKVSRKKRKLWLLDYLMNTQNTGFDVLLRPCADIIARGTENKRDLWRNTDQHKFHVMWNSTSTACIFNLRPLSECQPGFLYAMLNWYHQFWVQLFFIPDGPMLYPEPYFNENDAFSWWYTSINPFALKLYTSITSQIKMLDPVDCYLDGGELFGCTSLYHLTHHPLLVNQILQLPRYAEGENQRTYALSDLRIKGKELHSEEKLIIKSIAERSLCSIETIDTASLLRRALFYYKYGNMNGLSTCFREYESRSSEPPSIHNTQYMSDLWIRKSDEVRRVFKQCTFENTKPLVQFLAGQSNRAHE